MLFGLLCGVAAGALWGSIFLMPRVLPQFSPLELACGRYLAWGAISLALCLPHARDLARRCTRDDLRTLVRLALIGNVVYYVCVAMGVQRVGVVPTSLIVGLLPVSITLVGARLHPADDRLTLRALLAPLALIALGIVCLNADVFRQSSARSVVQTSIGLVFAVAALAAWTDYAIRNAVALKSQSRFTAFEWNTLLGLATGACALGLLPALWVGSATVSSRPWGPFLVWSAGIAVTASIVSSTLWNIASKRLPLTLSGQLIVSETVFAALYGFVWEARWPRALETAAIVLLVAGVVWSVQRHAAPRVADGGKSHTLGADDPA